MKHKLLLAVALVTTISYGACTENKDTRKIDSLVSTFPVNDSIGAKLDHDAEVFEVSRDLNLAIDSITILRDSLNIVKRKVYKLSYSRDSAIRVNITTREKLGVAEFKLLRIREYNRIAGQGNNIKFLRGWINRTLK